MGYSQPKKKFDLEEFLKTPAKKRPFNRKFGAFKQSATAAKKPEAPSTESDEGSV